MSPQKPPQRNPRFARISPAAEESQSALSDAARDVLAERRRQQEVEGWTPEHDDPYKNGELARAAACYAICSVYGHFKSNAPAGWPWAKIWWKPTDSRRDLVKAAALIMAEIERLDRITAKKSGEQS